MAFNGSDRAPYESGCLSCHTGIMSFAEGEMMHQIQALGKKYGDPDGCVICHGGTPSAVLGEEAHRNTPAALRKAGGPQRFYPNPGNLFVAEYTCGQCHDGYTQNLQKSLIGTRTEYVHRNLCIAALEKSGTTERPTAKKFGQFARRDEDGLIPVMGSRTYKEFMTSLTSNSELFAERIYAMPEFEKSKPSGIEESQCTTCHGDQQSQKVLEDEHGSGCSACHVPYKNGGVYLGRDPTIDKSRPGKLLVHRLQGTATTRVTLPAQLEDDRVKNETYSGIPVDNCFTCHYDVREETLNPIGTVMTHYGSRHRDGIGGELLCQDCHTTSDMHGDGNIALTSHAQMEVTCQDCHGTVEQAPWDLPLGYGGPAGNNSSLGKPRGLARQPLDIKGARYDAKEGYLLTSRGNPFGNVVKDGDRVLLHSASGRTIAVPILKSIRQNKAWKSDFSRQAMFEVKVHQEKMACLSCHADAVQPCFGCHVSDIEETARSR